MTTPINPIAQNVAYKPNPLSAAPSTPAKVQNVSVKEEEPSPSSSHAITVIHPADPDSLSPLLEKAPANSEVVLNEEKPEVSVDKKTKNIFERFCCCYRK